VLKKPLIDPILSKCLVLRPVVKIRIICTIALMVAELVKNNICTPSVITESFYVTVSATKHVSKQANIKLGFI
jgi:hypothetical protein